MLCGFVGDRVFSAVRCLYILFSPNCFREMAHIVAVGLLVVSSGLVNATIWDYTTVKTVSFSVNDVGTILQSAGVSLASYDFSSVEGGSINSL